MAENPSTKAKPAKPFPTPYRACKEGDCSCGQIWSKPADAPILKCVGGPWGESWPALRTVDASKGMSGTTLKVEADTERMDYGSLNEDAAKATRKFVVRACNSHAELVAACKAALDFLGPTIKGNTPRARVAAIVRAALADGDA